jgi:hypothetical protein
MNNPNLVGKKAIADYVGRNFNATIKHWIDERNFPAKKIDGVWHSHTELVNEWIVKEILEIDSRQIQANNPSVFRQKGEVGIIDKAHKRPCL